VPLAKLSLGKLGKARADARKKAQHELSMENLSLSVPEPEGEEATVQDPIMTAAAATGGSGGVAPGRKSNNPALALVHAFHCKDDRCTQRACFETKGVLKPMVR
jgi:hypothetical protein